MIRCTIHNIDRDRCECPIDYTRNEYFSKPTGVEVTDKNMDDKTIGEKRVRTSFNPSNNDVVDQIKQKSAELINLCETLKEKDVRLVSLAQTAYEEAAMWAVKAATA